eukprot:m.110285 g.110285  ORF g.110285 m.110285 type:complete len:50 (+) comp15266_c0_seq1:2993-3142(+)
MSTSTSSSSFPMETGGRSKSQSIQRRQERTEGECTQPREVKTVDEEKHK